MKRTKLLSLMVGLVLSLAAGAPGDAAESAGQYEGSWSGTQTFVMPGNNVINSDFGFEVVSDGIASVDLSVVVVGSGCSPMLSDTTLDFSSDPVPITDSQFSIDASTTVGGSSVTVGIDGTFESAAQASGTLTSSASSGSCEISLNGTWHAGLTLPDYQPDALVKAAGSAYVGQDVYDPSGKGQVVSRAVKRGGRQVFFLVVSNDGKLKDKISGKGEGGAGPFTVRYFDVESNGRDVTGWVTHGSIYWNVPGASGNWGLLKVVVSVSSEASPPGKSPWM